MSDLNRGSGQQGAEQIIVAMASLSATGKCIGRRPQSDEIHNYINGGLAAERIAEVESYLAHDAQVFNEYLAMVKLNQAPAEAPGRAAEASAAKGLFARLQLWWQSQQWPQFGVRSALVGPAWASAMLVVAVGVAWMYWAPVDSTQPKLVRKSAIVNNARAYDWRTSAFVYGLDGRAASTQSKLQMQAFTQGCADRANCKTEVDQLRAWGSWTSSAQKQCRARGQLNARHIDRLKSIQIVNASSWASELGRWQRMVTTADADSRALCLRIENFVNRYQQKKL